MKGKIAVTVLPVLFFVAMPGFAALGGGEESVTADQASFHATRTEMSERGAYRLHEMSRGDGTLVREYVNPQGKVFGVSWSGPVLPDLSQLLGSSFAEFQTSVHSKPGRRRAAAVHNSDLVVESTGHPRAFYGRAYLNSMLPGGVTQDVVQ